MGGIARHRRAVRPAARAARSRRLGTRRFDGRLAADVERAPRRARPFSIAGWREEAGFTFFHFSTWAKARAMQHWSDRSGIAHRPMPRPYNGPQLGVGDDG